MKTLLAILLAATSLQAATDAADLRVLDGKVFTIASLGIQKGNAGVTAAGFDLISGSVIQSTAEGVLVMVGTGSTREQYSVVFVLGVFGKADNDRFVGVVKEAGLTTYTTLLGAKKTVRKFITPSKPTPEQVSKYLLEERQAEEKAKAKAADEEQARRAEAAAQIKAQIAERIAQDAKRKAEAAKAVEAADAKQFAADAKLVAFHRRYAERGEAESQFQLGVRILAGKGAQIDDVEGRKWLEAAAAQGHAKAKQHLETLK